MNKSLRSLNRTRTRCARKKSHPINISGASSLALPTCEPVAMTLLAANISEIRSFTLRTDSLPRAKVGKVPTQLSIGTPAMPLILTAACLPSVQGVTPTVDATDRATIEVLAPVSSMALTCLPASVTRARILGSYRSARSRSASE